MATRYWVIVTMRVVLVAGLALSIPSAAAATAVGGAEVDVLQPSGAGPKFKMMTSFMPGAGRPITTSQCLASGSHIFDGNGNRVYWDVVHLGPPFSGSASAEGYVMFCNVNNHDAVGYTFTIDLTACHLWVCNTRFSVAPYQGSRTFSTGGFINIFGDFQVTFRDLAGNLCDANHCP